MFCSLSRSTLPNSIFLVRVCGDKPVLLKRHDHLVDSGWEHLEELLHVSFRRRLAIELCVIIDKMPGTGLASWWESWR